MSWSRAGRIGLLGSLFSVNGCAPRTELVVNVSTDLTWGPGGELQTLHIEVRRGGSTALPIVVARNLVLTGVPPEGRLPLSFGLLPRGDDPRTPVWIEVLGCTTVMTACTARTAVVVQRALTTFVPDKTFQVDLMLAEACRRSMCGGELRCNAASGACMPVRQPGRELVGDQAAPPPFDAGAPRG